MSTTPSLNIHEQQQTTANILHQLRTNPGSISLYFTLAKQLYSIGNLDNALKTYLHIVSLEPKNIKALFNCALINQKLGIVNESLKYYHKCLRYDYQNPLVHNNIGLIYIDKNLYAKAIKHLKYACDLDKYQLAFRNNLALALRDSINSLILSKNLLQKSLLLKPSQPSAIQHLGIVYAKQNEHQQALKTLLKAKQLAPYNSNTYYHLALLYQSLNEFQLAQTNFAHAISLNPNNIQYLTRYLYLKRLLCDWDNVEQLQNRLHDLTLKTNYIEEPCINLLRVQDESANIKNTIQYTSCLQHKIMQFVRTHDFKHLKTTKTRLNIGYLQGDHEQHPLHQDIFELLQQHNTKKFNVHYYSYSNKVPILHPDTTINIINIANLDDKKICEHIYKDRIDILIDLQCLCFNNKATITCSKSAPIQINYSLFPSSFGSKIDYILVNRIPRKHKKFSENFAHMPSIYYRNYNKLMLPTLQRCHLNLPETGFILASFTGSELYDPHILSVWASILETQSNCILWLEATNPCMEKNLRDFFKHNSIDNNQILFAHPNSLQERLAYLSLADLVLDTTTYNNPMQTLDSLYVNVPPITMNGDRLCAQTSSSILRYIELKSCIASNTTDYKNKILTLASDHIKYAQLKKHIVNNKHKQELFCLQNLMNNLEKLYTKIWDDYINNKKRDLYL